MKYIKSVIMIYCVFFYLSPNLFTQEIKEIKVPFENRPTLQQALDEFYVYSSKYNYLTLDADAIKSKYGYNHIDWDEPMLMWLPDKSGPRPYWTSFVVITYAQVYRVETDLEKKSLYAQRAKAGAEYLLWLQANSCNKGGLPPTTDGKIPTTETDPFNSSITGIAFIECWKSFDNKKYYDAALLSGDYILNNPIYPYQYPPENYKYYSNVNQLSRTLWFLTELYKITDSKKYLDRACQVAEEIMAWQDFQDLRDPWGELLNADSTWDGGWYYYDYAPQPIPKTCEPNLGIRNGFGQDRRISYHTSTLYSLMKLLEVTQQQLLPDLLTIRNKQSFLSLRKQIINSVKRGLNFMIDNQEEVNSSVSFRGLFKEYKNYKNFNIDDNPNYIINKVSAPHGLNTLVDCFTTLLKTNVITSQDQSRLESLINGVSSNMLKKYSGNWYYNEWLTEGMMFNWARFIHFQNTQQTSVLELKNNGFEEKEIIWELSSEGSSVSIVRDEPRTGLNSLHIFDKNIDSSECAAILLTAYPNTFYQVNGYFKYVAGGNQFLGIEYFDKDFQLITSGYQPTSLNPDYQLIQYGSLSPHNTSFLRIILSSPKETTSEGYWDDITINYVLSIDDNNGYYDFYLKNYPNPFATSTIINYSIPSQCYISLGIFDLFGNKIADIENGIVDKGEHSINFEANELSTGMYIIKLLTPRVSIPLIIMLIK